jgi:hypothetical protein
MGFAPEAVQSDHELERRSTESASAKEAAGNAFTPFHAGVLSAFGTDGSDGSSQRIVTSPIMRHAASGEIRVLALRRAQQGIGNHNTQHLVSRLQRSPVIQRECSCGGTCEACQEKGASPIEESEETGVVQRHAAGGTGSEATVSADVIPADSPGRPLDHGTRSFMESRFGTDFSDVRVHTDTRAADSADALAANAYTTGRDIYFAAGKYTPTSQEGQHLLAHELTHTIQQESSASQVASSRAGGGVLVGGANDWLETEAEHTANTVVHTGTEVGKPSTGSATAVRRDLKSTAAAIWDATGGRVASAAGAIWDEAKETAAAFVDRMFPGLLPLLRNAGNYLFEKITSGMDKMFSGIASRVQKQGVVGAITGFLGEIAGSLGKSLGQLVTGSCHSMVEAASTLIHFIKAIGGEAFAELSKIAKDVGDFFSEIWHDYGAPALDAIKEVAGEAWGWIKEKAQWLWDRLLPIRQGFAKIWGWIKKEFNLAKEETAGLLEWLYDKAKEQWMKIRDKIAPVLGPLKLVAGALLLLSPLGPIILIVKGAPYLWQALQWIWTNGIKPASEKLRAEFREHILPHILDGIAWITGKLDEASAFLCGQASAISTGLRSLEEGLGGIPFLGLAARIVGFAAGFFENLAAKGKCKFSDVIGEVKAVLHRVQEFLKPVLEALRQAALIATYGPWAILDDGVWKSINQFVAFVKRTPCLREIAGLLHVDGAMAKITEIRATLKDIVEVLSNQAKFEAAIHKALDGLLALIPGKVEGVLAVFQGLDGRHLDILLKRYIAPKLADTVSKAPKILIDMAWSLVWPWPGVIQQYHDIEKQVDKLKTSLWDFEFSKAMDAGLAIWRGVNGIIGLLYGWFFLAAVLIGAVFGAPQAGAAVAYEVGEALLVSTLIAEGLSIEKAKLNLMSPTRLAKPEKDREEEDKEDYETVSGGLMNLAIMGALAVLGEIAVDFAKAVFAEIKGLFLPEGVEPPKVDVPTKAGEGGKVAEPTTKPGELPEGAEPAKPTAEEHVAAQQPAADNHTVKVTDEGECLVCTECKALTEAVKDELAGKEVPPEEMAALEQKADAVKDIKDPAAKAKAGAEVQAEAKKLADEAQAPKEPSNRPAQDATAGPVEGVDPKRAEMQKELSDLEAKKGDAETRYNELLKKAEQETARAAELRKRGAIEKNPDLLKEARSAEDAAAQARNDAEAAKKEAIDTHLEAKRKAAQLNTELRSKIPCFGIGTPVWTPNGPRNIEQLCVGELVLAYDFEKRTTIQRKVLEIYKNRTMRFYELKVSGVQILATGLHRFWVESERDWIEARNLHRGMELRTACGNSVPLDQIVVQEIDRAATFNLHVAESPTYFVGPGVLVHNEGAPAYDFGNLRIYEGVNPKFPDKVYIGQTNDLSRRQGEHQAEAAEKLSDPNLTPEEREFWEFKKDMVLKERVSGLNSDQANYLEQKNIDIETEAGKNVMNRREQVSRKNMADLEQRIKADPKVQEAGLCQ